MTESRHPVSLEKRKSSCCWNFLQKYCHQTLPDDAEAVRLRPTEQELLKDLWAYGAHADERAEPLPHESEPLKKLKGSVKKFERPTEPAADLEDWDAWFDGEGVSEDFMKDRGEKR